MPIQTMRTTIKFNIRDFKEHHISHTQLTKLAFSSICWLTAWSIACRNLSRVTFGVWGTKSRQVKLLTVQMGEVGKSQQAVWELKYLNKESMGQEGDFPQSPAT